MTTQKLEHRYSPHVRQGQWDGCTCYEKMGADFWFLPTNACLRSDSTCNNPIKDDEAMSDTAENKRPTAPSKEETARRLVLSYIEDTRAIMEKQNEIRQLAFRITETRLELAKLIFPKQVPANSLHILWIGDLRINLSVQNACDLEDLKSCDIMLAIEKENVEDQTDPA